MLSLIDLPCWSLAFFQWHTCKKILCPNCTQDPGSFFLFLTSILIFKLHFCSQINDLLAFRDEDAKRFINSSFSRLYDSLSIFLSFGGEGNLQFTMEDIRREVHNKYFQQTSTGEVRNKYFQQDSTGEVRNKYFQQDSTKEVHNKYFQQDSTGKQVTEEHYHR